MAQTERDAAETERAERAERIEKIRRRLIGASYDSERKLREAVARMLSELDNRSER